MNTISSPWALIRHVWMRNFQQSPVRTVVGSTLLIGGAGVLMFFSFFLVMTLLLVGAVVVVARLLFGAPRSVAGERSNSQATTGHGNQKTSNNSVLEGEYQVVSRSDSENT